MIHRHSRRLITGLLAVVAAFCLLLVTTVGVLANTVHVYDNAHVLDVQRVQSEAQTLPYPIDIYTVTNFQGTSTDFNRATANRITSPDLIVIAIDTVHKYVAIDGGKNVSTSNTPYNDTVNAFKSGYNNGGYTQATIAAIDQLRRELGAAPNSGSGNQVPVPGGNSGFAFPSFGVLCCIGLLVLAGLALFGVFWARRRRFAGGVPPVVGPFQQPYQQPYNQGYPPNYYGPGYNQGQGMNPWAAGGLGAAAGGFLGYEL